MFDLTTYPKKQEIPQLKTVFSTLDTLWSVTAAKMCQNCVSGLYMQINVLCLLLSESFLSNLARLCLLRGINFGEWELILAHISHCHCQHRRCPNITQSSPVQHFAQKYISPFQQRSNLPYQYIQAYMLLFDQYRQCKQYFSSLQRGATSIYAVFF